MKKIRILLITSMPWREDNNVGNSYSNLFGDIEEFEIAHVYCRDGQPYNAIARKYFQISERRIVKNFFNSAVKIGRNFEMDASCNSKDCLVQSKMMDKARLMRWELFFILRDLIWFWGRWKTKDLYDFVEDFKPDIIFGTLTYMSNVNRIMTDLNNRYHIPLVLYSWDDVYSWHHFSWNPLFLLRKWYNRHYIRQSVECSSLMYVITKEMQTEYNAYFHRRCKLLFKSYDFGGEPHLKKAVCPYHLVFMGNIGAGRWKTLAELAKTLDVINREKGFTLATLDIYTLSPLSESIISSLNIQGCSHLNKAVPQNQVMPTQQEADILVHVEPLSKKEASFYRLSFSTKLVDYLYNARCILGLGHPTATLQYIENNEAGIVINDISDLRRSLSDLFANPDRIERYGLNAWNCGARNHERKTIRKMLIEDLQDIANPKSGKNWT